MADLQRSPPKVGEPVLICHADCASRVKGLIVLWLKTGSQDDLHLTEAAIHGAASIFLAHLIRRCRRVVAAPAARPSTRRWRRSTYSPASGQYPRRRNHYCPGRKEVCCKQFGSH